MSKKMSLNLFNKAKRLRDEAGIALITALLLLFLMSSLLVGFCILLISNQQLAGSNNDDVQAFYAAEAGMEQLTANLGNLFAQTYSPTLSQINALETTPGPPAIPGVTFTTGSGTSGYTITLPATTTYDTNGNPIPATSTVKAGPYAGLSAFLTEYTLTVNARTALGREVKLQRTTQTVGIPAFSFGVYSSMDLSFFPGPDFSFGGRTHTNGNLYLATGGTLTLSDKVDAYKDVIRTTLSNGYNTSSAYAGTVQITTNPGSGSYRTLGYNEGSYNPLSASGNSGWPTISTGPSPTDYNHNLIDGLGSKAPTYSTGAQQLNLGVALLGNGATQTVDLIRRPLIGEAMTVTAERYYDQASLRVLISDNSTDITNLPCIDGSTAPFDLSKIAVSPGVGGVNWNGYAPAAALYTKLVANGVTPLPLAASGAAGATGGVYTAADGYWLPSGYPVIKGFIKIEEQTSYGSSAGCGSWKDVTVEVLGYGYVGRNINPVTQSLDGTNMNPEWQYSAGGLGQSGQSPNLPVLNGGASGYQNGASLAAGTFTATSLSSPGSPNTCLDPHPYAIIRLERIRDNPSSVNVQPGTIKLTNPNKILPVQSTVAEACGWDPATKALPLLRTLPTAAAGSGATWVPQPYDFWPNVLFDPREGELREASMSAANLPTLNGTLHYIELDVKNLTNWFAGKVGGITTTGTATKDPANASNNFVVYISDRRGNYADTSVQNLTGGWPPLSFTKNETGEYGWTDIVNGSDATNGCPNNSMDTGEDENTGTTFTGNLYYYGAGQKWIHDKGDTLANLATKPGTIGIFSGLPGTGLTTNDNCAAVPSYSSGDSIWPMMVAANPNAARENPALFFRRAVKVVNGNNLTALGACPGGNNCGLSIATENPMYVQGDYNANSGGNGFSDPYAASSVNADAVTLLSTNWSDINSFLTPYSLGDRVGNTSYYRMAVLAGVTVSFPQPSTSSPQDFGTDGGVHNFLRYIEDWSNQTLNYKGSIVELYYSRQANGTFKCCNTVYSPPTRGYNFDTDFLNPLLLPPRTPLFRDINTTGWTRLMLASQ